MYILLNCNHHIKKVSCFRFSLSNTPIFLFISLICFSTPTSQSCKFDGVSCYLTHYIYFLLNP